MASSDLTKVEISEPPKQLSSSVEAVEFMSSVEPDELRLCFFSESLQSISEAGAEVGSFTVNVQPAYYEQDGREDEKCVLVHISSHSLVDDVPCGSSITAYISLRLETLEQNHHEFVKLKGHSLDKKTHMRRQGDQMVINRVITEGQRVHQETASHDCSSLTGLVSEASNLLIMRLLARRKTPQNLDFLTLDAEMNLCVSSYRELGTRPQLIGKDIVDVYGLERAILSDEVPVTWQGYFLPDGHLSSRVQVGSPVTMRITQMPILSEPEEEDPKPVFEKKPLNWEDDAQLYSQYLERKEELLSDHETYLRRHPEIKALLGDFMQFLLLRKPEDVITFAAEFFGPFSSAQERGETFRSSAISSPFREGTK
ncbi:ciliogenesis-associated TTC17-interacting protein [Bufo gargarizans]|uniref:ciliogenesis-associated TTC17-interacting protein n=1 Tax=Bufo gargarizans TaxID=30331 RepID=UPI001CF3074D|nr:ciliogenesis-associated TTC17-interacting protein [Bufo gargarizans]